MQSIKEYRREAERMALAVGDLQSACMNSFQMLFDQLWSGDKLTQIKEATSIAEKVRKSKLCNIGYSTSLAHLHSLHAHSFLE